MVGWKASVWERVSERGREKRWKRSSPREKGSASGSRSVEGFVCGESLGDKSKMVPAGLVDTQACVMRIEGRAAALN